MVGVLGQHRHQLPTSQDQRPVQHLPPNRAHPPLRIGVRTRSPHRCAQHLDRLGGKDRVKRGGELGIPITQYRNRPRSSPSCMRKFRACWTTHSPTGCAVTASTWTRRVATSIANRTYSRRNKTVSTVKKSTASTPLAWPAGTAARSAPTAPVPEQPRRAAGWSTRCWPRSGTQGGTARRGCGDIPRSGSLVPAVAPTRGAPRPHADGPADADTSSGVGPGPDASGAGLSAGRSSPARPGEAGAAPARPAPPGPPNQRVAGPLGGVAPRPGDAA